MIVPRGKLLTVTPSRAATASGVHLEGPHDGLALVVANDLVARIVQRREEDLQVIRVGIDAHDNAGHARRSCWRSYIAKE